MINSKSKIQNPKSPSFSLDPITLEVLWNRLIAVVNEQAAALMRTSFTSIVRESGDLSAGVFDPYGSMIAQAVTGTPGHINAMATCIHHFLDAYPAEDLRPGDVLITNHPQQTSGHLHDLTVITPIFQGERLVAFFGNTCHAIDIGGIGLGTDARSVYEEGLCIPITRLYTAGEPNEELLKIIRANVRAPAMVIGDLHAQVAGNDVGGRRLLQFMDEFGLESIQPLADAIIERSERAMRQAIAELPDGTYQNTVSSDGYDEPVRLSVQITKRGDELWVDFAGSSPVSPRGINVVLNYTHAYATYALKCALAPEVPNNEGSFRPVHVTAPEGCILNAQPPAPVAARHIIGHFLPGLIFGALAPVIPDRVMAEGAANIWATQFTGYDPSGHPFTYVWFSSGGMGARPTSDGLHATAFPSGVAGVLTEVIEALAPLLLHRRELRADSGGPGRFHGGCGQTMEVEVLTDEEYRFSPLFDRSQFPAAGSAGGQSGAPGVITLSDGTRLTRKGARILAPTTRVTLDLPGGGGYGDPRTRDPDAVLEDVRSGLVTRQAARSAYGVVITGDGIDLHVDAAATKALRDLSTS